MKSEILHLLQQFQAGYDRKEVDSIDAFYHELFDSSLRIAGTSGGEWCLNEEDIKSLFINDWMYWGFDHLDFEHLIVKEVGELFYVLAPATFSYTFKYHDENYQRYLTYVESILKEETNRSNQMRINLIQWILTYFLTPREEKERTIEMELRVSFTIRKIEESYKIVQLQFSVPTKLLQPDARMIGEDEANVDYEKERAMLKRYPSPDTELQARLQALEDCYLISLSEMFCEDILFIDFDNKIGHDRIEANELVKRHQASFDQVRWNASDAVYTRVGSSAYLLTNGFVVRHRDEEEIYQELSSEILKKIKESQDAKELLPWIHREISYQMLQVAGGKEFIWPIRLEAILQLDYGQWKFSTLHFSYPFNYYLDGKNEFMKLVTK